MTNEKQINKRVRREIVPCFMAGTVSGLTLYFLLPLIAPEDIDFGKVEPWSMLWVYGLTMAAFNLTAFAVLQSLMSRARIARLRGTKLFPEILQLYFISTLVHLLMIPLGFLGQVANLFFNTWGHWSLLSLAISFGLVVASVSILYTVLGLMKELLHAN